MSVADEKDVADTLDAALKRLADVSERLLVDPTVDRVASTVSEKFEHDTRVAFQRAIRLLILQLVLLAVEFMVLLSNRS
jgi:hypothetical protein